MLTINLDNILFLEKELSDQLPMVEKAKETLLSRKGAGNAYLGWLDWPIHYDEEEFARILAASKRIKSNSRVLVVIGIGGSYLGAKAVYEALSPYFKNDNDLEIVFAGNSLSAPYLAELLSYLEDKDFSINVISKSGTTTEPAIAFRALRELLVKKYNEKANERIYVTTDIDKGALRIQATELGYESFRVPNDIGGRYSVFTAVGLLPLACGGIDISSLLEGATNARSDFLKEKVKNNVACLYANARHLLTRKGKTVEFLVSYEPKLSYLNEWWKQLFGESEGKDGKGLLPASMVFSTDLHSLGQYIQEGQRIMFETTVNIVNPDKNFTLHAEKNDLDQLNYLDRKTLDEVNKKAMMGTILAHVEGNVPNIVLNLEKLDAKNLGYLLYSFMLSCALSCYMLEVNPFNQPGVESYKKNMFALLDKPGYEEIGKKLKEQLK